MTSSQNNQHSSNAYEQDKTFEGNYPAESSGTNATELATEPVLSYGANRKLNKKGVLFLGAIALTGTALLAWGWSQFSFFGKSEPKKPQMEVVEIPEDPTPTPTLATENNLPPVPPMPEQTTAVETIPVLPTATTAPPSGEDELTARRKNSGGLLQGEGNGAAAPAAFAVAKGSVSQLAQTDYLLARGTYIRCVLETRIVSDLPGFASCIVTEPVYSMNGNKLLIPKGSKVSGQYKQESLESGRVGVVWERVLTTDGLDIGLVSPGVDGLGAAGHPGHIDRHWGSRITAAVLISLIGDAVQIVSDKHVSDSSRTTTTINGTTGTVATQTNPYQSQTANTLQQLSRSALQEAANRQATITINQGELINIYASRDIDFSTVLP
jgi:type IV secretion system protein VirB10